MNSRSLDLKKGPGKKEKYAVPTQPFSQSPKAVVRAELQDSIRRRAEEIYIQSGQLPGRDLENWMQAEREILEQEPTVDLRCAIIVKINGVKYLCEYCPQLSDGYVPGEIGPWRIRCSPTQGRQDVRHTSQREGTRDSNREEDRIAIFKP